MSFENLEELSIAGTKATDASVGYILRMPKLNRIIIDGLFSYDACDKLHTRGLRID